MRNRLPLPPRFILFLLSSRAGQSRSRAVHSNSAKRSADGSIKMHVRRSRVSLSQIERCQQRTIFEAVTLPYGEQADLAPAVFDFELAFIKSLGHLSGFTAAKQLCAVARVNNDGLTVHCNRESLNSLRGKNPRRISRLELQRAAQWPRDKSEIKSRRGCTAATDTRDRSRRAAQPMSNALP